MKRSRSLVAGVSMMLAIGVVGVGCGNKEADKQTAAAAARAEDAARRAESAAARVESAAKRTEDAADRVERLVSHADDSSMSEHHGGHSHKHK